MTAILALYFDPGLGTHGRTYETLDEPTRRTRNRIVISITTITRRSGKVETA